jgi:hypothetical protein
MPSFMSVREPILAIFESYVTKIHVQDLLSGMMDVDESICLRALLHMDQCMYNYTRANNNNNNNNSDNIMEKILKIARSYITREDIRDVHDIQSHHRYVIMKASDILKATEIDVVMSDIFSSATHMELVIDFEESSEIDELFDELVLQDAFNDLHSIHNMSIIGENLTIFNDTFLSSCTSLKSVTIPHSITTIGSCFLYGCKSLVSFSIPNSVTYIEGVFLYECTSVTTISKNS